jgi:hypothetical protein
MIRRRLPVLLLAMLLPLGAAAQDDAGAQKVEVGVEPPGGVTVGTPVAVDVTVLVPTYMPEPPVWPDLQIADAITRLPARATHPVTRRVGAATWSGLVRRYEIIPQRPADFELAGAMVTATLADPEDNAPRAVTVPLPAIAFSTSVPAGAEDLDPFIAAAALSVTAAVDGLPPEPKPGDAFTLTLSMTASGPPAMLLPPMSGRVATPAGLRAYPKQPELTDADGRATRRETTTYVIEQPGTFQLPALAVAWWNTISRSVETAATDPIAFDVPAPAGWHDATAAEAPRERRGVAIGLAAALAAAAAYFIWRRSRPKGPGLPSGTSIATCAEPCVATRRPCFASAWTLGSVACHPRRRPFPVTSRPRCSPSSGPPMGQSQRTPRRSCAATYWYRLKSGDARRSGTRSAADRFPLSTRSPRSVHERKPRTHAGVLPAGWRRRCPHRPVLPSSARFRQHAENAST